MKYDHVHYYDVLDSTNDEAIKMAQLGCQNGTVIVANHQRAGRGRVGKSWISLDGNLFFSVIYRGSNQWSKDRQKSHLAFIMSIAVRDVIAELVSNNVNISLKWPNDVLIDNKKISGILLESRPGVDWVVIGVGVNLYLAPDSFSFLLNYCSFDKSLVFNKIVSAYTALSFFWEINGFGKIRNLWLKSAYGVGKEFVVTTLNQKFFGQFVDIDLDGRAIFISNGNVISVNSGEIFVV